MMRPSVLALLTGALLLAPPIAAQEVLELGDCPSWDQADAYFEWVGQEQVVFAINRRSANETPMALYAAPDGSWSFVATLPDGPCFIAAGERFVFTPGLIRAPLEQRQ